MKLRHFENTQDAIEFITKDLLWSLKEDLAAMAGSEAAITSDEAFAALEDKIADIEAIAPSLTMKEAA